MTPAPELVSHLMSRVAAGPSHPAALTELRLTAEDRAAWETHFAPARHDLEAGRGFVIFDRLPLGRHSVREATALYWLIGQFLGEPLEQNVQGTLLYDVRDTGQDVASGARFSVTNYESSFHTDNSFGDAVLDYVGLLCLRAARQGGASQNVSGHSVCDVLRRKHPDELEVLSSPFHVDRRGGVREGESPTVRRPVVASNETGLLIRYLRYWIEAGHENVAEPQSEDPSRSDYSRNHLTNWTQRSSARWTELKAANRAPRGSSLELLADQSCSTTGSGCATESHCVAPYYLRLRDSKKWSRQRRIV